MTSSLLLESKPFWIVGHWHSANMGDKYQPFAVWMFLTLEAGIPAEAILCVNYSKCPVPATCGHLQIPTVGLDELLPADPAFILLVTGSMNNRKSYVPWLTSMADKGRSRIMVWGGFAVEGLVADQGTWLRSMAFLGASNIHFLARSECELALYREIVKDEHRGELAGDPMAYYAQSHVLDRFGVSLDVLQSKRKQWTDAGVLFCVPSSFGFLEGQQGFEHWDKACATCSVIRYVDSVEDRRLPPHILSRAQFLGQPWKFIEEVLGQASVVVTSRLHAAVLASLVGVPTQSHVFTEELTKLTFVGTSACGLGSGLFAVNDASNGCIDVQLANAKTYVALTHKTLEKVAQEVAAVSTTS
jgi:hypothetical protein